MRIDQVVVPSFLAKLQHVRGLGSGGSEESRISPLMLLLAHGTTTEPSITLSHAGVQKFQLF